LCVWPDDFASVELLSRVRLTGFRGLWFQVERMFAVMKRWFCFRVGPSRFIASVQFSWYRVLCHPRSSASDDFQLCFFGNVAAGCLSLTGHPFRLSRIATVLYGTRPGRRLCRDNLRIISKSCCPDTGRSLFEKAIDRWLWQHNRLL